MQCFGIPMLNGQNNNIPNLCFCIHLITKKVARCGMRACSMARK